MKGIIPTGGRGTRMRPITFSANKHFVPVGNKPLVFYPIESVVEAGIKEIAITYNPGYLDIIKQFLGDGSKWSAKFTYVLQPEPIGLANIVEVCEDFIDGDSFVFILGDNIFTEGISKLVNYFEKNKPDGLLAVIHHPENTRMGVPYYDKNGKLIKYVEKPKNPPHDLAIPGLYLANSHFFECFRGKERLKPSARGEYEIPDAYQWMIDHGYRVETLEINGKWMDPGKQDDWLQTNQFLLDLKTVSQTLSKVDSLSQIEGRVSIGKNCQIGNSIIRGPVNIADGVTIIDSFIGPYTSIARNCEIISSRVENSVLMTNVKIKNAIKLIEDSLIGPETEISGENSHSQNTKLFVGEMCKIDL